MSDERKVPCPCGSEMQFCGGQRASLSGEFTWFGQYVCKCGWRAPYREGETQEGCKQNAYLSATQRPPNKSLTREQVEAMPAGGTIWRWHPVLGFEVEFINSFRHSVRLGKDLTGWILFAANPMPADIEAARKESANGTY